MDNNLVDKLFDKSKNFQMGIFCTYSFNLKFFENYLLNLRGVANCSNLCVFTDRNIYNSHFNINVTAKPKWINKRYLVIPVDTNGVFHPKLYLLASDKTVRIGVGSANLTREGLASNLEIVSVLEITEKDSTYSGFLRECLNFLRDLANVSQSTSAIESVNKFISFTSHLLVGDMNSHVHLMHNLEKPIMPKVIKKLKGCSVKSIKVISPFYDKNLKVHHFLKNAYPNAVFTIYIQQGKSNFPVDNYNFNEDKTRIYIYKDYDRYIHGKALIFETENCSYLLTGSTNYTESALLTCKLKANIETSIFGEINSTISKELCEHKGISVAKLDDNEQLKVTHIENEITKEEGIIQNWLIEALYENNQLEISLNENNKLNPKYVIINGNEDDKIEYNSKIDIKEIKKSELIYAHVEGIDENKQIIKSNKIWIVKLDKEREYIGKRRIYITDSAQITTILLELIENSSEQDLIEYLLSFNIPLDLAGFKASGKTLRTMESKGNIFGELIQQSESIFKNPGVFEAANQFLVNNTNKLLAHYNDVQLNKLDNFMLIYGTIFNMMRVFNDYIVRDHKKNPIEAMDWAIMRNYYDMLLQYIKEIFSLIWLVNDDTSFEELVNGAIKKDKQQLLGNITSFKSFIIRDYERQYELSLRISKTIIKQLDLYIEKGKIKTVVGKIVNAPIARNGIKDNYIIEKNNILELVNRLISDFQKWKS